MKKTLLFSLVALAATSLPASAQSVTGTVAPKPGYTCDFENAENPENPDFTTDQVIVINGKRWRFHNVRITDSAINGIPQGKRAAELLAGAPNGEPATLELLDTVHDGALALCFGHSGMDRTINRNNEAWTIEVTNDDGATWATNPLRFDNTDVSAMQSFESPFYGDPFRLRIRYTS